NGKLFAAVQTRLPCLLYIPIQFGKSMTLEERLLSLICRKTLSDEDKSKAGQLLSRQDLDWASGSRLCAQEQVYPLAFENLRDLGLQSVPRHAREHFTAIDRINAFRNERHLEELIAILDALHQKGVPTIPLKGLALAQRLYGNIRSRTIADIDILVPTELTDV